MNKRAFLTSILGLVGGAALTSLNLESAKSNAFPAPADPGEIGQSGVVLARDDEDHRRRRRDDEDHRRRRRGDHDEERRRRRRRHED